VGKEEAAKQKRKIREVKADAKKEKDRRLSS
jgi:hypothetical protein